METDPDETYRNEGSTNSPARWRIPQLPHHMRNKVWNMSLRYKLVPLDEQIPETLGSGSKPEEEEVKKDSAASPSSIIGSTQVGEVLTSVQNENKHKSKAILLYLSKNNTQYDPETNRIIYDGGIIGSPLPDLLWWTVSPDRDDRPWDQFRFFRLLTDISIPKSLYGPGKFRLANAMSRPHPIAIKKRRFENISGGNDKYGNSDQIVVKENRWRSLFV